MAKVEPRKAATEAPPATSKDDAPRVSLALTADGKRIDWSKVRESRRPELEKLFADDPKVRALVAPADGGAGLPIANKAFTDSVIEMLGQLEGALAVRLYGVTMDDALTVCQFSANEKAALADPLERVINKHGSVWLTKYGDELALGVLLLSFTRNKMAAASQLAKGTSVQPPIVNNKNAQNL
jgi:hypothetical protein